MSNTNLQSSENIRGEVREVCRDGALNFEKSIVVYPSYVIPVINISPSCSPVRLIERGGDTPRRLVRFVDGWRNSVDPDNMRLGCYCIDPESRKLEIVRHAALTVYFGDQVSTEAAAILQKLGCGAAITEMLKRSKVVKTDDGQLEVQKLVGAVGLEGVEQVNSPLKLPVPTSPECQTPIEHFKKSLSNFVDVSQAGDHRTAITANYLIAQAEKDNGQGLISLLGAGDTGMNDCLPAYNGGERPFVVRPPGTERLEPRRSVATTRSGQANLMSLAYNDCATSPQEMVLCEGRPIGHELHSAFAVKVILDDKTVVRGHALLSQFDDFRQVYLLPNAGSNDREVMLFCRPRRGDIWCFERELQTNRDKAALALQDSVFFSFELVGVDQRHLEQTLQLSKTYQEAKQVAEPGQYAFVTERGIQGVRIFLRRNRYPTSVLAQNDQGELISYIWRGSYGHPKAPPTFEDVAQELRDEYGAVWAGLLEEGQDCFRLGRFGLAPRRLRVASAVGLVDRVSLRNQ